MTERKDMQNMHVNKKLATYTDISTYNSIRAIITKIIYYAHIHTFLYKKGTVADTEHTVCHTYIYGHKSRTQIFKWPRFDTRGRHITREGKEGN